MPSEGANTGSCSSLSATQFWSNNWIFLPRLCKTTWHIQEDTLLALSLSSGKQPECRLHGIWAHYGSPGQSVTESPAVSPPRPPGAAAASPPPSGLPAPLGSTSVWPAALLTLLPLAAPASSAFLWDPRKARVTGMSQSQRCVQFLVCSHASVWDQLCHLHCTLPLGKWHNLPDPVSPKWKMEAITAPNPEGPKETAGGEGDDRG